MCVRVCVTVVATVLARTASSLHSGGGERGRSARSVGVREGAAADVATGLSLVLSDRDALWIGVRLSAGGRKGGEEGEAEREVPHREWSKWEETTRATGATTLHFAARVFSGLRRAAEGNVWMMTPL